jgi:hypothetical protein
MWSAETPDGEIAMPATAKEKHPKAPAERRAAPPVVESSLAGLRRLDDDDECGCARLDNGECGCGRER